MSIVTDERLMAYADGALPPEEARALEIMIAEDPALAARLTPFAMTGAPLAEVFDAIAAEPVPARLVQAIAVKSQKGSRSVAGESSAPAEDRGFGNWLARALGFEQPGLAFANAFAITGLVLAGGVAGFALSSRSTGQGPADFQVGAHGEIIATGALASALETRASSDAVGADGMAARSAFLAKDQTGARTVCREYRISGASADAYGGVACRSPEGNWRVATHTRLKGAPASGGSTYATASGDENAAIDATIGGLIEGDILTPDQEASLRAKGWK